MKTDRQSPISEYLLKLQLIVSNTEFKNKEEAMKYETVEMTREAEIYIHAVNETDIFDLYQYSEEYVYNTLINFGYDGDDILRLIEHPHMIPQNVKNHMMLTARNKCLSTYDEKNKYYRSLMGLPYVSPHNPLESDPIVCIPDEFYDRYKSDPNIGYGMPIHELPIKYQELYMNSKYYNEALEKYPDVTYLRFIGSNAIPLTVSRKSRDGDIMKINTDKLTTYHQTYGCITVSADIVHKFTQVYNETRDYVYNTLRGEFQDIYPNYNSMIRFLTIYMTIGNCMNEFMKNSTTLLHMNNASANNLFSLYGLPSVIMEGNSMIEFLKKFRLLLMDKGTNAVYRVKDLIGYEYTDIYSLIMVKQQIFHNGKPLYAYDPETGEAIPKQRIVFRRIGTTPESNSYFKFKESSTEYLERKFPTEEDHSDEYQISSGDPRWWESKEVNDALRNMNYTLSNSKYIQLSTHLSMTDIWFQSVILLRALLDNRLETEFTKININFNVNGSSDISVFDAVLCLIIIMNWQLGFKGNMYVDNNPFDGESGVLDLIYNGIYQSQIYSYNTKYRKNTFVGIAGNETLYLVLNDFTTLGKLSGKTLEELLEEDIRIGNLQKIDEYDNLSPKSPVYGNKFKIASFDFNLKNTKPDYYQSIKNQSYLEPSKFLPMLDNVLDRQTTNVGETVMVDVKLIYEYLESKLRNATVVEEYRQVTDAYNNLFLVDPIRDWCDEKYNEIDNLLQEEYEITSSDLYALYNFFPPEGTEFSVIFDNAIYPISIYQILNNDALDVSIEGRKVFREHGFLDAFVNTLMDPSFQVPYIKNVEDFSDNVKLHYKEIIRDKVTFDVNSTDAGPITFDALLHRTNSSLYTYMHDLKNSDNKDSIIMFMRALVKSLESYTNSPLSALEFRSLGVENYIKILKEVISYFKSYMVEFTKDEFIYLFDGIFDNGGNSNMIKLMDEIAHLTMTLHPKDSMTLFDVGNFHINAKAIDNPIPGFLRDEAIFRVVATYSKLKSMGMDIWYDNGKTITKQPFSDLTDSTKIIANMVKKKDSSDYMIIINKNNVNPDNYYGNKRKLR